MCRIAGIISRQLPPATLLYQAGIMCDALEHGGPDDSGLYCDEETHLVFGNRRLSIIDLTDNGHQPMSDPGQNVWITFNGEIYNYRELRTQLVSAGARFSSQTDTEVIINAYRQWGVASFVMLRGMFAFALYDKEEKLTYLVRDSMGIKPLYYYADNQSLSFSSEIRALRAAGIVTEADQNWAVRFLAFGHIPEPYTTLKNVFSLSKGHFLRYEHRSGLYRMESFHDPLPVAAMVTDGGEARRQIRVALEAAVKRQLVADAPIGVFLSGGVDSSLISLLANVHQEQQLKTISIYFDEKAYDERAYQRSILAKINGEKHSHLVQRRDFEQFFPRVIGDMDMPTTDGINSWFISKYAREDGLKAVLSGLGADELFGGYPSFNRIKFVKQLRRIPSGLFSAANYFKKDKYRKISFLAYDHYLADYLLLRGLFVSADIAKILDADAKEVNAILFSEPNIAGLGEYNEAHAAWFEANLYMQNQLLRDTDVMSMSHGLEVRVPFLDEDLQQVTRNISPLLRFEGTQPKKLLIDSFSDILPETIWDRPKMGFTFPFQEWMSNHPDISDQALYRGKFAKDAISRFKKGRMHWSKIFALYQIQLHG